MGEILALIFTLAVLIVPFLSLVMEVIVLWAAIVSIYPVRVIYDWGNHFPRIKKIIDWLLKYCFIVELILYLLCFGIEAIYMDLAHEVVWGAGWETQLINRQLQIANAFEDVLMEYTPRTHKVIRHIYDTYGFPIAKLIKKKWVADLVYFIMKPLEIIFLFVLYMTCVHPEDRIAMQYTGKKVQDIL